jgi:hypothetical protein
MIAAILLSVSVVAFGQFAIYYWRATIANASMAPVSDRVRATAGISKRRLNSRDFRVIISLHELTPALKGSSGTFIALRCYFFLVEKLGRMIPNVAEWAEGEMTMCSNYMAAVLERHLSNNVECAAGLRSI